MFAGIVDREYYISTKPNVTNKFDGQVSSELANKNILYCGFIGYCL